MTNYVVRLIRIKTNARFHGLGQKSKVWKNDTDFYALTAKWEYIIVLDSLKTLNQMANFSAKCVQKSMETSMGVKE